MFDKVEHIGIAVRDLAKAEKEYTNIFGVSPYKREEVLSEKVITSFFKCGPNKIELLQATSDDSVINKFLDKRGEGIHHIAFEVIDIEAEMVRLKEEGYRLLNDKPKIGADNKLICFIHPKDVQGVLIELCQEIKTADSNV